MTEGRIFTSVEDWEREFFPDWSEKKDKEESCDNHIPFGVILANEALQKIKTQLSKFD